MNYFNYSTVTDKKYLGGQGQSNGNDIKYIVKGHESSNDAGQEFDKAVLEGKLKAYEFFTDALLRAISHKKNSKK